MGGKVMLGWTPPIDSGGAIVSGYQMDLTLLSDKYGDHWKTIYEGEKSEFDLRDQKEILLDSLEVYKVQIRACNFVGCGPSSDFLEVSFEPSWPKAPETPYITYPRGTSLVVNWVPHMDTGGLPLVGYEVNISTILPPQTYYVIDLMSVRSDDWKIKFGTESLQIKKKVVEKDFAVMADMIVVASFHGFASPHLSEADGTAEKTEFIYGALYSDSDHAMQDAGGWAWGNYRGSNVMGVKLEEKEDYINLERPYKYGTMSIHSTGIFRAPPGSH